MVLVIQLFILLFGQSCRKPVIFFMSGGALKNASFGFERDDECKA